VDRPAHVRYILNTKEEARESAPSPLPVAKSHFHTENHQRFKELVNAAVNETIVGILGQQGSESFFTKLRDERGIPRDMVAQRLEMLFGTLDQIFGIGNRTVGRAIIRNLYRTLGLKFAENPDYDLSDYVEEALFDYVREIITLSEPKTVRERIGTRG
jgi:hypothetical protein